MNSRLNPALTLAVASAAATSAVAGHTAPAQMVQSHSPSKPVSSVSSLHSVSNVANYAAMGLSPAFYGSATIVAGAAAMGTGHGKFAVAGVKPIATGQTGFDTTLLVLRSITDGGSEVVQMSVRMSEPALLAAGVVIGSTIQTIATAVGWAVRVEGRTIGFALNEHGRELMRQEKIVG
jgi:hypothetical protein